MDAASSYVSLEEIPAALLKQTPWDKLTHWWQWPFSAHCLLPKIIHFILAKGFVLTLVGGGMRSLLTNPSQNLDDCLDFEIRHPTIKDPAWPAALKAFLQEVAAQFPGVVLQEHLYLSFSLTSPPGQLPAWQMDLTSPRLEHHTAVGRHGFTAQYFANLPYPQAWRRRDFTINALGVECGLIQNEARPYFRLVDPFQGWRDWQAKKLNIISEDFYQDPVRFLRFGRWWAQGWRPGPRCLEKGRMDLSSLSKVLLEREACKGDFLGIMATWISLGLTWEVKWPQWPIFSWPWARWQAQAQEQGIKIVNLAQAAQFLAKVDPAMAAEFAQFWQARS